MGAESYTNSSSMTVEQAIEKAQKIQQEAEREQRAKERGKLNLTPFKRDYEKIQRNAPCVCGSGHKFKHCCGARAAGLTPRPKPEGYEPDPVIEKMFAAAGK